MLPWDLVNSGITKDDLVGRLLVILAPILAITLDRCHSELFDNLLNGVLQEPLKGEDLLGDQTILFEVTIDDFPAVIVVDRVHVGSQWCV